MGGEWEEVALSDVANDITVGHVGLMAHEYVDAGIPFLRSLNVRRFELDLGDLKFITDSFHRKLGKSALRPGDVIVVRTGKPGSCAVVPESLPQANCSDLVIIRPNKRARSRFLSYVINSTAASHIDAYTVGAVQQHFNIASARLLKFRLPRLSEQDRILDVLGALDDKIDLNRRMAETLEAMARALFKSWFVDFDPVHAKAEGRPTGLPDDLAARFPDSFGEDGLPRGWKAQPLSELGQFLNGLALQKYPPSDAERFLPVIKIAELRAGPTAKSDRASSKIPQDYLVADGDHLFSWSGSLTHCRWTHGPGALNQHLFKVTSRCAPGWLLYEAVEHHLPTFQAIASGKAVTMGHIQRHHLDEALIAVPTGPLLEAISAIMAPLHERSFALALQSRTLAELRDTLLPKLISGELRIADAEQEAAAA